MLVLFNVIVLCFCCFSDLLLIIRFHALHLLESINSILYHFIANTNSVHKRHINKKVMEFVKGKSKGTNPAIMGNPIDMYAVNGIKKQSESIFVFNVYKSDTGRQTATRLHR